MPRGREIGFSLVGGLHQLPHFIPVAVALSRRPGIDVHLFAASPELEAAATQMFHSLGGGPVRSTVMRLPAWLNVLGRVNPRWASLKAPRLAFWAPRMRRCRAVVTAERTSTLLKVLPGRCPPLIHIPHGAGDRAKGFERRIAHFDRVIVAGEKDRQRMIGAGLVSSERCHVSGYIKYAALAAGSAGASVGSAAGATARLFGNSRPIVLYNPHFDARLSSWSRFAAPFVDAVAAAGKFNLIVAPHVRLFEAAGAATRRRWESLAIPDRVHVDLGSSRSMDMTYTRAADIYVGDVSSQVYEFAAVPRPCVFVNAHAAQWQDDPDYLMWRMGEVADSMESLLPALERAADVHARFREVQARLVRDALGDLRADCAEIAADIILRYT